MLKVILITLLTINSIIWAESSKKSLQTTQFKKTTSGVSLQVSPIAGHHFNLEAPNRVRKNNNQITPLTITPRLLTINISSDEKCELQIETYICDDEKTFCSPQNAVFNCSPTNDLSGNSVGAHDVNTILGSGRIKNLNSAPQKNESFIVNDPKMALQLAQKTGRPLLIDFFGTWCPPCNILDETAFNSEAFKKHSKDFVLLKLDADDKVSWDLKSKFAIKGYPTVVLATPLNEEITRFIGAIPPAQIAKLMKKALKNKNFSLSQQRQQYASRPTPKMALEIIDSLVSNDDFIGAMPYISEAAKDRSITIAQKELLLIIPLFAVSKEKSETISKISLPLLKGLFADYPISDIYGQKLNLLNSTAELLKDDDLKKWVNKVNIKNIESALTSPKLNINLLTRMDLLYMRADSYEKLGLKDEEKKAYSEIAGEYLKLMTSAKQNVKTNRGYNLERIYAVYKSGAIKEARAEYEKLIQVYPHEFTFHYNYASILKDLKDWDPALDYALKALQYSYGDNQLRSIYLVAEIEYNKGLKNNSLDRLTKAIESTELPKDESVRTHRYVKKLADLKKKIQEDGKSLN